MAEYLEDTGPTLDEICVEYEDGDCKDCPAYDACPNDWDEYKKGESK